MTKIRYICVSPNIVPIPSTKRQSYLQENVGTIDAQLTPEELAQIDEVMPPGIAVGSLYQTALMQMVNL